MGKEEQDEEREVLDSIFPDEIQDVSEGEYRITVRLDEIEVVADAGECPSLVLHVRYPENYPDVAPYLDISAPPDARRSANLNVHEDKTQLLEALQATIDENIGMAMVFTLVTSLKEAAESLVGERNAEDARQIETEARRAEEEENRKFQGTAVTPDTFLEWHARFKLEMEQEEKRAQEEKELEDRRRRISKEEKKLTGRQLWERGLAGRADADDFGEDDAEIDDVAQKTKEIQITAG